MEAALAPCRLRTGTAVVTIVSHSFELATRDGTRVNRLVRGRFESLCALPRQRMRDALPTARFADARPCPPRTAAAAAAAAAAAHRAADGRAGLGDRAYERPAVARPCSRRRRSSRSRILSSLPASDIALPLRIGARTLWTLRRRLVRRRLTLDEALAGAPPALPPLADGEHGYLRHRPAGRRLPALGARHPGLQAVRPPALPAQLCPARPGLRRLSRPASPPRAARP